MENVLVTGCAGFIGSHTAELLCKRQSVIGVDNLNDAYDVRLKKHRLERLSKIKGFHFKKMDVENYAALSRLFSKTKPSVVYNLAARAGVRYSIQDPFIYLSTNTLGTLNLLELCRKHRVKKFVLASTSSLYAFEKSPFKENRPVNTPLSPYAASKKGAEAMCYSYHHLHGIDVTVLRYFTVYGPAGRPDMSYFKFIRAILEGQEIPIYGDGSQDRDFTYVDDIAAGTVLGARRVGFRVFNLGNERPWRLNEMIALIEKFTGKKARRKYLPFHKADMKSTCADTSDARKILGWQPRVGLEEGLERTVRWFKDNAVLVRGLKHPSG